LPLKFTNGRTTIETSDESAADCGALADLTPNQSSPAISTIPPNTCCEQGAAHPISGRRSRCFRRRRKRREGSHRLSAQCIDAHGPGNILHRQLALVAEDTRYLVANLVICSAGNAQSARIGQSLQPRGDVNAVAVDIVGLYDDIAKVHADTKVDAPVAWDVCVAFDHSNLDFECAAHGIDDACKLHQRAVTGALDDPAAMTFDRRAHRCSLKGAQPLVRRLLVEFHEPGIADHVHDQNRG
jgi:hypothetical protein